MLCTVPVSSAFRLPPAEGAVTAGLGDRRTGPSSHKRLESATRDSRIVSHIGRAYRRVAATSQDDMQVLRRHALLRLKKFGVDAELQHVLWLGCPGQLCVGDVIGIVAERRRRPWNL